jgi:hypothetical protein
MANVGKWTAWYQGGRAPLTPFVYPDFIHESAIDHGGTTDPVRCRHEAYTPKDLAERITAEAA